MAPRHTDSSVKKAAYWKCANEDELLRVIDIDMPRWRQDGVEMASRRDHSPPREYIPIRIGAGQSAVVCHSRTTTPFCQPD